jgi:arylsulfatase A-like enzyme
MRKAGIGAALVSTALLLVFLVPGTALHPSAPRATAANQRPDIVLMLTDDQTIESVTHMPYLQQQISNGSYITFTNAEVNNSLCCPSRSAIMSGKVDTNNHVENNSMGQNLDTTQTVQVALHNAGYRTGLFGKLLNYYAKSWGREPGWDDFEPLIKNVYGQFNYTIWQNGTMKWHGKRRADYAVDVLTSRAVQFINKTPANQPLYLELTPTATHTPFIPAPRHASAFANQEVPTYPNTNEADVSDKPQWVQQLPVVDMAAQNKYRLQQWRSALGVDDMLRSVEQALAARGRLNNAVVVFMSDNGLSFGAHRWPVKWCEYRECGAVPMAVRYPGQQGRTSNQLVSNIDLAPTFAEIAGTQMPSGSDGVSLVPLLTDPSGTQSVRSGILEHWPGGSADSVTETGHWAVPAFYGIRTVGWRYVELASGEKELYDEVQDPYELQNQAGNPEFADVQGQLAAQLYQLEAATGVQPGLPTGIAKVAPPSGVLIDNG